MPYLYEFLSYLSPNHQPTPTQAVDHLTQSSIFHPLHLSMDSAFMCKELKKLCEEREFRYTVMANKPQHLWMTLEANTLKNQ